MFDISDFSHPTYLSSLGCSILIPLVGWLGKRVLLPLSVCVCASVGALISTKEEARPHQRHFSGPAVWVVQRPSKKRGTQRRRRPILEERMESNGDEANNENGHKNSSATTADSNGSNTHGRPHHVDNTDTAVSAGAGPTCLCGHRSSAVAGSSSASSELPPLPVISLTVAPTTGGQFELKVSKLETIDNLKKTISKRLKVPKERICLLWKDRYVHPPLRHWAKPNRQHNNQR